MGVEVAVVVGVAVGVGVRRMGLANARFPPVTKITKSASERMAMMRILREPRDEFMGFNA